jgi:multidrug transporter EmrE-like cation transporter
MSSLYFWIVFNAFISSIPITLIKLYVKSKNILLIIASIICFTVVTFGYTQMFKTHGIIVTYIITKILSDIFVVASGILFFKEMLNLKKIVGILLAFISVHLISS